MKPPITGSSPRSSKGQNVLLQRAARSAASLGIGPAMLRIGDDALPRIHMDWQRCRDARNAAATMRLESRSP